MRQALSLIDGIRLLSLHCCRRTYVSQMQALGVDFSIIQRLVGHAQIDMTEHQLHVQDPVRKDAINRFREASGKNEKPELHVVLGKTCRKIP